MCKVLSIFAILALLILFSVSTNAQGVIWNAKIPSSYLWDNGGTPTINPNTPFVIELEADNDNPTAVKLMRATWHVYGKGGIQTVDWIDVGGTHGEVSVLLKNGFENDANWDIINLLSTWNWDGTLPDTINHSAVTITGLGWPAYSSMETHYEFHLSIPLNPGGVGEICIDSIAHELGNFDWFFDHPVYFDGPFCWPVEQNPSGPHIFGTPASLSVQHHINYNETYTIIDPEGDPITGVGAIDDYGDPLGTATLDYNLGVYSIIWEFDPDCGLVNQTNRVRLYAEDAYHSYPDVELYEINLNVLNSDPTITGDCGNNLKVYFNDLGIANFIFTDPNMSSPDELPMFSMFSFFPTPDGWFNIDPHAGEFYFGPTALDIGQTFTFTVGVEDCGGGTDICDFTFKVNDTNDLALRPNPDGWNFANTTNNMWPPAWWAQFNYLSLPYSSYAAFTGKSSSDFPDWPLFVDAFGKNRCYIYTALPTTITFRLTAMDLWESIIGPHEGSAFGFALTSFLYYDGYLETAKTFPGNANVYDITLDDSCRKVINKYWIYQNGANHLNYILSRRSITTPSQTLEECQNMFNNLIRDDKIMLMFNNGGLGGHAVTPYRCENETHPLLPHIWYIYVYDSNYPNDETKKIIIDTNNDTWDYDALPGWGGAVDLFLMEPISFYTSNPIRSEPTDEGNNNKTERLWSDDYSTFYFSQVDSVLLESPSGSIGHYENNMFNTNINGMPLTLLTGQETPPKGYYLTNDNWDCNITGILGPSLRMSMFANSTVWTYRRENVAYTDREHIRAENENRDIMIYNPDTAARTYQFDIIEAASDSEIVWTVSAFELAAEDSTGFSITAGERQNIQMQIDNYGEAGTYNLATRIVGYNGNFDFFSDAISIPENSSQRIIPDGRENDNSVMIITDPDMTGLYTDTSVVNNEWPLSAMCGDANNEGHVNILDIVFLINYKYKDGPEPVSINLADVNGDELVNILDIVYLINYKYKNGPGPACL